MIKNIFKFLLFIFLSVFFSCSNNNDNTLILNQQTTKTYELNSNTNAKISGTAKFIKNSNGSVTLEVDIDNAVATEMYPAYIHFNTAAETGNIALDLGVINGATGKNDITFTTLDNGTSVTYEDMIAFSGYINIHLNTTELTSIVAQGDIGQNALTGVTKFYTLSETNNSGISGTAQFFERVNRDALAVLELNGTFTGTDHLAHIHMNDAVTSGDIVFTYNSVNGETGVSKTNLSNLNNGTPFNYENVLSYNGYINIHTSTTDLNIVAQGNIGSNENIAIPSTFIYNVTNTGTSAYNFAGNGLTGDSNPDFTLVRGNTYIFNISTPGHPFYIKTVQGNGADNAYFNGVTGNGTSMGTLTFLVPEDAPNMLFYNCQFHSVMTGVITVID